MVGFHFPLMNQLEISNWTSMFTFSMDGHRVQTIEDVTTTADVFITCTGNRNVITRQHMNKMKNGAVVANMGHR